MQQEIHIELLLGRRVMGQNNQPVGRLEDIRAELRQGECYVTEFLVGSYAILDRLSALMIGRALLKGLRLAPTRGGYRVSWDKLDLSDPDYPRLLCKVSELLPLNDDEED